MMTEGQQRQLDEEWNRRAERFEAAAAKLQQRARDIRHTLKLNALEESRAKPPRCQECDAELGTSHYSFCSYDGEGVVVT